ncbi:MAG: cupredoxin family protein [Hydrogenophaga sp.]|nr:cupredoxin family protein [Hydrogenophaga sp.]
MTLTTSTHRRVALRYLLAVAGPALLPLSALAHGDAHPRPADAEVVREQMPWGIAAAPAEATRRIDIRMGDDMRFTPSHIEVREGETVHLRIANRGKVLHELVLGTREALMAHAEMMKKHPNMQHDEPYMAHVPSRRRGEITWTFNRPGDFEFACLIPGHFEAGMRGTLRVLPTT